MTPADKLATRSCPNCSKAVVGHPNKRFCRAVCKDRYHNRTNPRGFGQTSGVLCDNCEVRTARWHDPSSGDYLCDVCSDGGAHPFSDDAVQGTF